MSHLKRNGTATDTSSAGQQPGSNQMNTSISRADAETDRLVGALSKRSAQRTGRDVVRIILDLLYASDLAGLDGQARLDLFQEQLTAKRRYCQAEGLDFSDYVDAQREAEVDEAVARIRVAMSEN